MRVRTFVDNMVLILITTVLVIVSVDSYNTKKKVEELKTEVDYAYVLIGTYHRAQSIHTTAILGVVSEELADEYTNVSEKAFMLMPVRYVESVINATKIIYSKYE